jgi:hypothetical protein
LLDVVPVAIDGDGGSGGGGARGSTGAFSSRLGDLGGILLEVIGRQAEPGSREEVEPMGERERREWLMLSRRGGEMSR